MDIFDNIIAKAEQLDKLAKRLNDLYYQNLLEVDGWRIPDWNAMPEHQRALRAALYKMVDEGLIEIVKTR